MFYSHSLLSRKGPLGTIWIAAYCFKKLKRGQIDATDISSTVDKIMPEIQISHRVLAQLLFGIVKIFSKKVDFLYVECNETLIQITRHFSSTQKIGKYTASHRTKKGIRGSKEVTFDVNHISTTTKNENLDQQIETMRASYHQFTVTLPERFELDTFDLGILDNGDIGKSHQLSSPQDEWKDDRSSCPTYLNECSGNEAAGYSGYNPPCFTPLADILPSSIMDVDLELGEPHNSNNFANVQKSLEEFHCEGDSVSRANLSGNVSIGVLHDELPEINVPLNHEHEPLHLIKSVNLQRGEPSGSEPTISNSFASVQKSLEEIHSRDDSESRENLSGNAPLGILHDELLEIHASLNHEQTMPSVEEKVPINLRKRVNLQGEEPSGSGKKHCFASPSDKQKTSISGATASPKFMLASPAINESPRVSRKRKKHYDGSNVLSNEVMRQNIHDASDLVCKRRKLPHTKLEIWRILRFSTPGQIFTEPLIPFFFPELGKLPLKKSKDIIINPAITKHSVPSHKSSDAKEKTEVLIQKLDGEPAAALIDPTNAEENMPNIEPETSNLGANQFETSDNQFELMELGFHGDVAEEQHDNGLSPSTRAAAQYLYNRLLRHRKQKKEETVSLAQVLEGRTRTESARFFYDTLDLKTIGCINVRQDVSYGDVFISATPLLEAFQRVPN